MKNKLTTVAILSTVSFLMTTQAAISVKSCDEAITFTKAPEKVLMISETNAPILQELGVLDKVAYRAGSGEADKIFTATLKEAIDKIPEIKGQKNATGGISLSTETVIETGVDLVIGYDLAVDRQALKKVGIQLYTPDTYCNNFKIKKASWELVDTEIDKMATLFDVKNKGDKLKSQLKTKLAELNTTENNNLSAVALYIGGQGEAVYAYGASSMIQPIFEANGIKNAYGSKEERVFAVTTEDLLDKNPDWIIIFSSDYAGDQGKGANNRLLQIKGASGLKALEKNQVIFLPFNLASIPSNLSVQGAVTLKELMEKAQ